MGSLAFFFFFLKVTAVHHVSRGYWMASCPSQGALHPSRKIVLTNAHFVHSIRERSVDSLDEGTVVSGGRVEMFRQDDRNCR